MVYALSQHPIRFLSYAGLMDQGNRVENRNGFFHYHPRKQFLLPVPVTLSSAGLEILVPEWDVVLPGATTNIPLNWQLRLPLVILGF